MPNSHLLDRSLRSLVGFDSVGFGSVGFGSVGFDLVGFRDMLIGNSYKFRRQQVNQRT
jgi:hypothetical protein